MVIKKINHHSYYQHYRECCQEIGVDITERLDDMLILDFIICNRDRHYNNFGMIRNVNTLQIEKAASIFDSGTSAFAGISKNKIKTLPLNESKPFCKYHEEQIALIQNIERYEFQKLTGLEEEFNELLQRSPFITISRRDKLVTWLGERIRMLCESKMDNRKSLLDREDSKRIPEKKVR